MFPSKLVADRLYHDCVEVPDSGRVEQSQNENSIKADFNYQGLVRGLRVRIGHPCILGSRISVACTCFKYHPLTHMLSFLLRVNIFATRILAYVHLSFGWTWLPPLRIAYMSMSGWFKTLRKVHSRNMFLLFFCATLSSELQLPSLQGL
jgi:hypothetical protein